jgi:hypothetical protein
MRWAKRATAHSWIRKAREFAICILLGLTIFLVVPYRPAILPTITVLKCDSLVVL